MIKKWRETIKFICKSDPAIKSSMEVFMYQGFHALLHHQLAHFFYKHNRFIIARFISQVSRMLTGIEIHPGAKIHHEVFIDHGMGVVIGETAIIGKEVIIYHGVTLGASSLKAIDRHPIIGNNVIIGAHTQIIGRISIGNNSKLAPSLLIKQNIPPNTVLKS
ncbi:MAG: serine O-acetyltransferase [Tissierellales bacterium]|jgi:serine O-acetyltransferase|nr:serine O-acetyltransferase [Tissierellales bacterium]